MDGCAFRAVCRLPLDLLLVNIMRSRTAGAVAGPNPWDAPTLEWSVSSPPPPYNFAIIPVIASRHPLWEDRLNENADRSTISRGLVLDAGCRYCLESASRSRSITRWRGVPERPGCFSRP
jgi:heme/copper-type cytochrome/quinol oxidase subunit 1